MQNFGSKAIKTMYGSCLCEGVRFSLDGEPQTVFSCFCSHCSKNAGGPSQYSAKYLKEQVTVITGNDLMRTWVTEDNSSSRSKHKVFCGRCGCTLWTIPMHHKGTYWMVRTPLIHNGLESLPPKVELFASQKPSYLRGTS
ncbi:hypothetical protein IQ07DRAFT_237567 [Pyrenochaeta sp. DS3sAY3a]|nr:hypothetical protein IQ07DRAFT_237567 [Pyrenochaeta sp. DS3sAY3a]